MRVSIAFFRLKKKTCFFSYFFFSCRNSVQERYSLVHVVVELTFLFLRVIFRVSPLLRSSDVFTQDTDTVVSTRPIHSHSSPCSRSSLSHVHRFMVFFRNQNGLLSAPPSPTTSSGTIHTDTHQDSIVEFTPAPTP